MEKAQYGDFVEIQTKDKKLEGTLIPSQNSDSTVLKLENGYNIGILNSNIKSITKIKSYEKPAGHKKHITENSKLPKVAILSTGGTISSKVDYRTGGAYADYTAEDFIELIPELSKIANIKAKKVMSIMSEDILAYDWIKMANLIEETVKEGFDGIVLTHGTDTMHFTTAILSFMLSEINIPIIVTGSQRSIDRGSSDAFMNLHCAVKAAAEFEGKGVYTCMHGTSNDDYCILIRGTKVRKMHTSRRDAFRPINEKAIAKVWTNKPIEILNLNFQKSDRENKKIIRTTPTFEPKVALHYIYPGMEPDVIDFYIEKKMKGIVIAATALGHVNTWTELSLIPYLKKCAEKNIPVFITSQTLYGKVNPYVYTNLRKISQEAEGIFLEDMMPEVAYVKLGWVLAQTKDREKIKEMMLTNYANEINYNISEDDFLN